MFLKSNCFINNKLGFFQERMDLRIQLEFSLLGISRTRQDYMITMCGKIVHGSALTPCGAGKHFAPEIKSMGLIGLNFACVRDFVRLNKEVC
jgi:hypothetical protein